jgi:biotin transport system substrate-specific component
MESKIIYKLIGAFMSFVNSPEIGAFDPLHLGSRSRPVQALFVVLGTLALAISSQIAVPMVPVPITMQMFAVTMIGALYGWRLAAITILAWLGEAAAGLPVLSGGAGGLAPFVGPSAGYLVAFPIVGALTGWLASRGWTGDRIGLSFAAHLLANILCLAIGGAWLALLLGAEKGWALGVAPFILGGFLKSALAVAVLKTIRVYAGKAN